MTIASRGGTAWLHPVGLWVYVTDSTGRLIVDYQPQLFVKLYQPVVPLERLKNGGFRWHEVTQQ